MRTYTAILSRRGPDGDRVIPVVVPVEECGNDNLAELGKGTFSFLNHEVQLGWPVDWFPEGLSQLWLYNLHYFDYALELGATQRAGRRGERYALVRSLVSQWIGDCPVGKPVAWDPYPISLRIRNWILAYTLFESEISEDVPFGRELRHSLRVQSRFLEKNLEYHLSGNHLLENGRALWLAGLFFTDHEASRWRSKGEAILRQGLTEQFTKDGGHYERSPMYHQLALGLYQEVVSILEVRGQPVLPEVSRSVHRMRDWLRAVLHPDGEIPLLNDAALGIAGSATGITAAAMTPVEGLTALDGSGYFVFRSHGAADFLILDCGPMGPDHQPGHGHCDTLSYELSLSGLRFIVDSGVDDYYGDIRWRNYFRSTRAHNTVVVDGREQSEIWSRFRVGRRAHPMDVKWEDRDDGLAYVVGSHSGYRRLRGDVLHRRWIAWIDRDFWVVVDHVSGRGVHEMESLIHFHPEVRIVSAPSDPARPAEHLMARGDVRLRILPFGIQSVRSYYGELDPIQGWYAPEFGRRSQNHVWAGFRRGELPIWSGYVLWPRTDSEVHAEISVVSGNTCCVDIHSTSERYRLLFDSNGVTYDTDRG